MSNSPQTLVTLIKTRKDTKKQFATWQEKMNEAVSTFAGFICLEMRRVPKEEWVEWTSIQRFNTPQALKKWQHSEIKKALLRELEPFLIQHGALEEVESSVETGIESVTEVFVTRVTAANYDAYRAWASKVQQIEAQFPGYLGIYMQAPERVKEGNWITILRFDSTAHLDAWLVSKERKAILKESEAIVKELQSHRVVSPFSGWFAGLTATSGQAPPVWKQTMLVLLVLFPLVMLELKFLVPFTKGLNPSLATFIGNILSVSLVSWPMMPLAIWCLKGWLSPSSELSLTKNLIGTLGVMTFYLIEIAIFW